MALQAAPEGAWELQLHDGADPQAILEACFTRQIRLRSFSAEEPTLHDVFVKLVGPDATEARFR
jgi:ABC-type uncharacterized transport system ATPase subunit